MSLRARGISLSNYKKILSVMIEALENVFKYNEFFENEPSLFPSHFPKFQLERTNDNYYLSTGNPILKKDIDKLQNHIKVINGLDKEGLRQLFRSTLTTWSIFCKSVALVLDL